MSSPPSDDGLRIGVIIASLGRPHEVGQIFSHLLRQTRKADRIIFSLACADDAPSSIHNWAQVIIGEKGLCAQRNRAMAAIMDCCDIIVFFDDDYVPSDRAIAGIAELFARHPDIVGADGRILADGVRSTGTAYEQAVNLVEAYDRDVEQKPIVIRENPEGLYGCNMAYRASAIRDLRFDENLPLYGWQEDIDFAARIAARGRIVKSHAFAGVHRGVKGGRTSGVRMGYSQIANPVYLKQKGTMPFAFAAKLILRNVLSNHIRFFHPEPWIDRKGRIKGNWIALWHLVTGKIDPLFITKL